MTNRWHGWVGSVACCLLAVGACRADKTPTDEEVGGAAGDAGGDAGRGGSSASGHAGVGSAGEPEPGNVGGDDGGPSPGGTDGEQTSGGAEGLAGAAGYGGDASGGEPGDLPIHRADLKGPATDNLLAELVEKHQVEPYCKALGLSTDNAGNIFIDCGTSLGRFNAAFEPLADIVGVKGDIEKISASTVTKAGAIFVAGPLLQSVVVEKLDSDRKQIWRDAWTSNGTNVPTAMTVATDGALYVTGTSTGQAPGNPPGAAGGRWLARYEPDGTRSWLKQYAGDQGGPATISRPAPQLLSDSAGNLYTVTGRSSFKKFSASGEVLQTVSEHSYEFDDFNLIALAPNQKSIYTWTRQGLSNQLANFDTEGAFRWYKLGEIRTVVIDAVEGTTWDGRFTYAMSQFVVSDDAIYLAGGFLNQYQNGATPPGPYTGAFVGRYSLQGEREWFKEFYFDELGTGPYPSGGLALGNKSDLVVAFNSQTVGGGPFLFKLSTADGSVTQ